MQPAIYAFFLVIGFVMGRFSVKRDRPSDYDIVQSSYLDDRSDERLAMNEFDKQREIVR